MKRIISFVTMVAIDILIVNLALYLALLLRFDGAIPSTYINGAIKIVPLSTCIYIVSFYSFRLYKRLWQYASVGELLSIVLATVVGSMASISVAYFLMEPGLFPLPRSVAILWTILVIALIGISRFSLRIISEYRMPYLSSPRGQAVLIIGAGDAGAMVAREFHNRVSDNGAEPAGFIDDDPAKQGRRLYGLPVLGTREDIPRLVEALNIAEIVIAMPSVKGKELQKIVKICQITSARLRIVPGIYDLIEGKIKVDLIREVRIEDILGRESVQVDLEAIAGYLNGGVVLVTGAGGSIGSELCRQAACFRPKLIVLLGHGENSIYYIHQELVQTFPEARFVQSITDVKDKEAIDRVFYTYRPSVVFHAAAHTHVPLMELNPPEAIKNNIIGTKVVAEAADKYGSKAVILISTDKAVNPTSIMGASKHVAEMVVQEMASWSKTVFTAVRFGNVLGSSGSVVPLFQRQIAAGGPVTVTHPDMTRYFMTIPEAVQLVIQAGAMAKGGEIFVLDMGEPVRIVDLARNMITLSGYEPDKDIEICYTEVRPGEKLFEELLTAGEGMNTTAHERIFIARPEKFDSERLERLLIMIYQPEMWADMIGVENLLRLVLPDFRVCEKQKLTRVG